MHTGLSEEQRRQIEKMRRQSGRMPVYRKTAEKVNDFSEKTEELPQNGSSFFTRLLADHRHSGGNAAAGTVFAVSFERQFDLWI